MGVAASVAMCACLYTLTAVFIGYWPQRWWLWTAKWLQSYNAARKSRLYTQIFVITVHHRCSRLNRANVHRVLPEVHYLDQCVWLITLRDLCQFRVRTDEKSRGTELCCAGSYAVHLLMMLHHMVAWKNKKTMIQFQFWWRNIMRSFKVS